MNKTLSAKYEVLVKQAPELIKVLPWGPDFEVDRFQKPDFTALEVINFATGGLAICYTRFRSKADIHLGIPAGINVGLENSNYNPAETDLESFLSPADSREMTPDNKEQNYRLNYQFFRITTRYVNRRVLRTFLSLCIFSPLASPGFDSTHIFLVRTS